MLIKHQGKLVASVGQILDSAEIASFLLQNELDIPVSELELTYEPSEALSARKSAYKLESDSLFIEWQYDQTDTAKQKWLSKVEEIKARYPLSA
ncbi:hypothetical protein CWB96_18500 [Pseudoalteromonas citrea]|uniref:Uncharacterized protein n=1 Tax=Pseudoalteromonas citrea TaxID=43655 RepID=A0A5S3XLX5_9GAMM|nr:MULTISPECIES: hypothetical protein [Pseudoalteromonas]RJE78129.1 hypothetical protein BGP78_06350 [Pseudoalteromonas sp. MSK9-3]TMP40769.1 hypothetical protein CWB97_17180 [Pseudoalteromonas citrea]TMP54929.1 hypothetical protein CWB96_18500 [Pseudoalteromonas citrea]